MKIFGEIPLQQVIDCDTANELGLLVNKQIRTIVDKVYPKYKYNVINLNIIDRINCYNRYEFRVNLQFSHQLEWDF